MKLLASVTVVAFLAVASVPDSVSAKRWRALSCPTFCSKKVDPVCGSDGVIYKNACDMRKRTCNRDVKSVPLEECTQYNGSKCEHKCDKDKDMVCGTDGRTYLNKCFMQVEYCERGIDFAHYGPCLNTTAPVEQCPQFCTSVSKRRRSRDAPVCGSDGNVYESECQMKLKTCGQGVVSVDRRHCRTTEHCDSGCWRISRLTCGSDGKLYNNGCQMLRKNCGKLVFDVPVPFCLNRLYRTDCPMECGNDVEDDEPVCGSDGNVYKSVCEMKKLTCGFPLTRYELTTVVDMSLCASKVSSCAKMQCPDQEEPVCGNDGATYTNACHLRRATCLTGVQVAHVGRCTDLSKDAKEECPKECDEKDRRDEWVCGSDGNAYRSECEMQLSTCGQRVVLAPRSHCQTTRNCDLKCPPKSARGAKKLVCGSDSKFYNNECEMRTKNCGRHMYVAPLSQCLKNFVFSGCGRVCPSEYDPVCGTDDKTYSNQCFMGMENCRARSLGGDVRRKYYGKCGEPKQKARHYMYRR